MVVGILKEPLHDKRVSMTADTVSVLCKKGIKVSVEKSAGELSFCLDTDYEKAGARIEKRKNIIDDSEIILSISPLPASELKRLKDKILVGVFQPLFKKKELQEWANSETTCFSLDMLPRTTQAQSMDVLSSQANIAGYKAVLQAANNYGRYFPMFMTAAGSIPPAKVLILGAGVAGLQAIATAKRLGAVVEVFDTRPAVKEEVMSLGGKFIEVEGATNASTAGGYAVEQSEEYKKRQQERINESIAKSDIVITTAQIPGKKAPILITEDMIQQMKSGSIIVDLAASTGGNTPLTEENKTVIHHHVQIIGNSNLAATMPYDASKLYGKNIWNFLQLIIDEDMKTNLNWEDELVKGACVTHSGEIVHERLQ